MAAELTGVARQLRHSQTDAEARLWHRLRARQVGGAKFRRQHPLGSHVADFCCVEAGLVVEVDGGQHQDRRAADEARTRGLEAMGYQVLRFWNHEVLGETESVLEVIRQAVEGAGPAKG